MLSDTEIIMRKGCCITNTSLRRQDPSCGEEEMEFLAWLYKDWIMSLTDRYFAYINGNRPVSGLYKTGDAEEVSYMADYSFDERNEIAEVHYVPVRIRRAERPAGRRKGGQYPDMRGQARSLCLKNGGAAPV